MPFQLKSDVPCAICTACITTGASALPLQTNSLDPSSALFEWVHLECVEPTDVRIPVCKHWRRKGVCLFKTTCQFRHPEEDRGETTSSQRGPRQQQNGKAQQQRHGTWKRPRLYNEGRAGAVRRWLLNVFGRDYLASGSGILDVAGGKGEISFEIMNLTGVPCTVFEPRPLDLYRYKRKLLFGYYHRNPILGQYNTVEMPPSAEGIALPRNIRGFFEMSGVGFGNAYTFNVSMCGLCQGQQNTTTTTTTTATNVSSIKQNLAATTTSHYTADDETAIVASAPVSAQPLKMSEMTEAVAEILSPSSMSSLSMSASKLPDILSSGEEGFRDGLKRALGISWTDKGLTHEEEEDDEGGEGGEEEEQEVVAEENTSNISNSDAMSVQPNVKVSDNDNMIVVPVTPLQAPADEIVDTVTTATSTETGPSIPPEGMRHRPMEGGIEVDSFQAALEIVQNCSVVVGMHPDQAAEHIITFALRNKKPFVIIPCCVYHKQFRKRKSKSGQPVKKYGELIEYLMSLSPEIHAVEMDFEGKNIMLYYMADVSPLALNINIPGSEHVSPLQAVGEDSRTAMRVEIKKSTTSAAAVAASAGDPDTAGGEDAVAAKSIIICEAKKDAATPMTQKVMHVCRGPAIPKMWWDLSH